MTKYVDYDGIQKFYDNIINAPIVEDHDYLWVVDNNNVVKTWKKTNPKVGDICFYDSEKDRKIIVPFERWDANKGNYSIDRYIPIGVVVIPSSHDVYGTGQCGVMSLSWMSCSNPDIGSNSEQKMCWGQYNTNINLSEFYNINSVGSISYSNNYPSSNTLSNTITDTPANAYLPSDNNDGSTYSLKDPLDSNSYYGYLNSYLAAPGPYLTDGSRNPLYYQTESPAEPTNALSDFDGVGNTSVLIKFATKQSDWKTSNTITDNSEEGYSPTACCCWRYHTVGTNQGDWYLPACGEVGYVYARYKTIANTVNTLADIYSGFNNIPPIGIADTDQWWSSTLYTVARARYIYFGFGSNNRSGDVSYTNKTSDYYARAFIRV